MKKVLFFAAFSISLLLVTYSASATPIDDIFNFISNLLFPPSIETTEGQVIGTIYSCINRGGVCKDSCGSDETGIGFCRVGGGGIWRDSTGEMKISACCLPKPTTTCPQIHCVVDSCPGQHLPDQNGCVNCASPCPTTTTTSPTITTTTSPECVDSDDGLNYYVRGTISGTGISPDTATDDCVWINGTHTLVERYCSDGIGATTNHVCQYGCRDGVCLSSSPCSIGTVTVTVPVSYGSYSLYADQGSNNQWARIVIKDSTGATFSSLIINQGESKASTAGFDIKVTAVRATQDGIIIGVDLIVGASGVSCETTTTTTTSMTTITTRTTSVTTTIPAGCSGPFGSKCGNDRDCDSQITATYTCLPNMRPCNQPLKKCYNNLCYYCAQCTDSDGGVNFDVRGTTTSGSESKTDSCTYCTGACIPGRPCPPVRCGAVVEYHCSGNGIVETTHVCPNGCKDGACEAEKQIIELVDSSCASNNLISLILKNVGTSSLSTYDIKFYVYPHRVGVGEGTQTETPPSRCVGGPIPERGCILTTSCDKATVGTQETTTCRVSGNEGYNSVAIVGPSNTIRSSVYCASCTPTACEWGIQYSPAAGAGNGLIPKGSKIQVVYKPTTTQYLSTGEKISAPSNAFGLGFNGWNTDKFANINVKPINGITAYYSDNVTSLSNLNGLEVASDVANSLQIAHVQSYKFYFLYDKISGTNYPFILAYFDTPAGKIRIISTTNVNSASGIYQLSINYGGVVTPYFVQYNSAINGNSLSVITAGINGVAKVFANYNFKSSWTTSNAAELKLGNSSAASEPGEVQAITEGTTFSVGLSHNDVVADGGLILKNPNENGWSDQVSLKVPDKELKTTVNFEYPGHAITTDIRLDKSFAEDFPNNGIVDTSSGVFYWKSNSYDFHEQVDVSGVKMRHDYGTTLIQGVEKMQVQSGNIIYEYVFDKDLNFNGSIANPQYEFPVKIKIMNKDFLIVGAGSYSVKVLTGTSGTATATNAVTYGTYSIYSTLGSNNQWASITVKDSTGSSFTAKINQGDSYDISKFGLTIKVMTVKALQDGTIIGTNLVVGPSGQVEKEYDTAADVTSTGGNDCFPAAQTQCKKPCPFSCCNSDDPDYTYQSCPQCACACATGQPCPPCRCPNMICQNHRCIDSNSVGHDVIIASFASPDVVNEKENFTVRASVSNSGNFTENVTISLSACSVYKVNSEITPTIVDSTTEASSSGGGIIIPPKPCEILSSIVIPLTPSQGYNFETSTSLPLGSYTLNFIANIPYDQNPSNNYRFSSLTVRKILPRFNLTFKSGWNMMSFPVHGVQDISSNCNFVSAWRFVNGRYVTADGVYPGYGYWVRVPNDCSFNFSGVPLSSTLAFSWAQSKDWNLIGSFANSTSFNEIKGDCNVLSGPWWYDPALGNYVKSNLIEPGKGYFIKVNSRCDLSFSPPPPPGP